MIHSLVLGILAIMVLLLGNMGLAHTQDRDTQINGELEIVVCHP